METENIDNMDNEAHPKDSFNHEQDFLEFKGWLDELKKIESTEEDMVFCF